MTNYVRAVIDGSEIKTTYLGTTPAKCVGVEERTKKIASNLLRKFRKSSGKNCVITIVVDGCVVREKSYVNNKTLS